MIIILIETFPQRIFSHFIWFSAFYMIFFCNSPIICDLILTSILFLLKTQDIYNYILYNINNSALKEVHNIKLTNEHLYFIIVASTQNSWKQL